MLGVSRFAGGRLITCESEASIALLIVASCEGDSACRDLEDG